ncbi:MAG: DUF1508 domain-containing protein [Polyangiaceae bacterium]|nr:DUF1508 domain-containing protein [Polyangiaceae bacterium]
MMRFARAWAAALLLSIPVVAAGCVESDETSDEQDATASTGRFETFVGEDGSHYFQLLAKNGERVLASEAYTSLSGAKNGMTSVKKNGVIEARYEVLSTDGGEFYFNLLAGNGQVIGSSETYTTQANAERAVKTVMEVLRNPTSAAVEEDGPRFETFVGADKKTYFRLRAGNGRIVVQSQGYTSKSGAQGGIDSVKTNGIDASRFEVFEGADGQHTFRIRASNGKIIGRGEMYASKSGVFEAAARVREILRELTNADEPSDTDIRAEIERAATGLTYMSESDYPFTFVSAELAAGAEIDESVVREAFASVVDADPDADKPLADLVSMTSSWQEWKDAEHNCADPEDPVAAELCVKMRDLEQVLEANLDGVGVYYFGANGSDGNVEGTAVSIFIVGRSPDGNLVGVRTLAIWT